ncbi:uncharacterized protein ACB058_008024 [Synchiropus picturatus]
MYAQARGDSGDVHFGRQVGPSLPQIGQGDGQLDVIFVWNLMEQRNVYNAVHDVESAANAEASQTSSNGEDASFSGSEVESGSSNAISDTDSIHEGGGSSSSEVDSIVDSKSDTESYQDASATPSSAPLAGSRQTGPGHHGAPVGPKREPTAGGVGSILSSSCDSSYSDSDTSYSSGYTESASGSYCSDSYSDSYDDSESSDSDPHCLLVYTVKNFPSLRVAPNVPRTCSVPTGRRPHA